jgi:methanethiol S-methyltransferase
MTTLTTRLPPLAVRLYALGAMAAFGLSLASGIWLYHELGRSVGAANARQSAVAVLANLLLFGLFALHHSLFARTGAKAWLVRVIPASLERSTYVWIASLLFLLVAVAWQPVPGLWYHVEGWPRWICYGLQGAGFVVTALGASAIDPRDLGGVRQAWRFHEGENFDASAPPADPDPFVTRGAYGLVRHPIYLGWFLMVWPTPLMTSGRLTFAAVSSIYLLLAIPFEERSLLDTYGDAYRRYRQKVRWRVLPGLY